MNYKVTQRTDISFVSGHGKRKVLETAHLLSAVKETHSLIDQIASFPVNLFDILGMRNLSSFIGELFAASLIRNTEGYFRKNPHQDGYPDLLLMDERGVLDYKALEASGRLQDKTPFSPFPNGGIEVKATCGSIPTPAQCRRMGLARKPHLGDQRIGCLKSYDWKAHHRDTNNLAGILWDFIDGVPRIVALFFCPTLTLDDWGRIIQPVEGGGRTTSVSIMTRAGVRKMYEHWILVYSDDPRYAAFLNRYNGGQLF